MALHTCQIQQYDFHHCEQQFEKQCGEGVYAPYNDSWHCSVFFFFICLLRLDSLMLPKSVQPSTAPQGER